MSRPRQWRAYATVSDPTTLTGRRYLGNASACSEAGLQRCVDRWRADGAAVTVVEALTLTEAAVTPPDGADLPAPAPAGR